MDQNQEPDVVIIKKSRNEMKNPKKKERFGQSDFLSKKEWIEDICKFVNPIFIYERVRKSMSYDLKDMYCIYANMSDFESFKDEAEWTKLKDEV